MGEARDLVFHHTVESQRSTRQNRYVAHMKFILTMPNDPDVVELLVVRQPIPNNYGVGDLADLVQRHAEAIEPLLRQLCANRHFFRTAD